MPFSDSLSWVECTIYEMGRQGMIWKVSRVANEIALYENVVDVGRFYCCLCFGESATFRGCGEGLGMMTNATRSSTTFWARL